jgi:hypothetical protein
MKPRVNLPRGRRSLLTRLSRGCRSPTTGRYYEIPFRALCPRGVRNLLVAGRCIAGDAISHASVRSMMCCAVTGQGAGVAAAVSVQDGVDAADVDIGRLQAELRRQGVRLH